MIGADGEYHYLSRYSNRWYYYIGSNSYYATPIGVSDGYQDTPQKQFYIDKDPKVEALRSAVSTFADATAAENDKIKAEDPNLQHRISVVKFSGDKSDQIGNVVGASQIVSGLTAYDSRNVQNLKDSVNSLRPSGATRADYGMELAEQELGNARESAQKVVIFFTDGEPNADRGFDDTIANKAIVAASGLNSQNTLVYTVGVFDGADASQTDWEQEPAGKFNAYMNAMSSKYPNATSYKELGAPNATDHRDYYRTAADADQLGSVFTDIAAELKMQVSGSPISSASGGTDEGYVTFTDELGQYMQVDDFKSIVYANTQYTNPTVSTVDNVTTYTFTGTVDDPNGIFNEGDLSSIVVTVEKNPGNLAQGDKVTVSIPASLLPMRNYKASVDKNGNVKWDGVTDAYPIRVFYGVSLKDGVADAIKNGTADTALQTYIKEHTVGATDEGVTTHESVSFLSNLYNNDNIGTTTATFTPAKTNGYYYVDQYTPLYVDEDCTRPLTEEVWNAEKPETFYYKQTVYQQGQDKAYTITESFPVSTFTEGATGMVVESADGDGTYGLAAGSPRLSRIRDLVDAKGEDGLGSNDTKTAKNIADPNWDQKDSSASQVTVKLGNNGKLFVELPGQLRVSKTVEVAAGLDKEQFANTEFSFTVHVDGMANQKAMASVVKTNGGAVVSDKFKITFDANGNYTHKIKDGETLVIDGLNDGASYTVTENLPANNGFTQTSTGNEGTISSTTAAQASFTNSYAVTSTELANGLQAQKVYTNLDTQTDMDWDGATFDFVMQAIGGGSDGSGSRDVNNEPIAANNVPMPGGATSDVKHQTVTNGDPFQFGAIAYTKPGTYVYHIWEESPSKDDADWRAGVDYSSAVYHASIVVKDNGDGTLSIDQDASTMYMERNDDGATTGKTDKTDTAAITNTYESDTQQTNFLATKLWQDNSSGSRPTLTEDQFWFVIVPDHVEDGNGATLADEDIPMPVSSETGDVSPEIGNSADGSVAWGSIAFTNAMAGKHYFYNLYEKQPTNDGTYNGTGLSGAEKNTNDQWVYQGVTYDKKVYTAEVEVGVNIINEGQADERQETYTHITYRDGEDVVMDATDPTVAAERVPFTNSYAVNPVVDDAPLQGQKTLDGRAMKQDETFHFSLTGVGATATAMTDGTITGLTTTATVTGDGSKTSDTFNFNAPTFTKAGTYTFEIRETRADGSELSDADDVNGMKYDRHVATVTYVVNDSSEGGTVAHTGNLRVVSVTYDNSDALNDVDRNATDKAPFTNTYRSSTTFTGITVSKTLTGRTMQPNEFGFTITPEVDAPALFSSDASFGNESQRASGVADDMTKLTSLTFTQADAGKTYSYIVDEVKPSDNNRADLPGVTYDVARYRVSIAVTDDGAGTLTATPTIVKIDESGNAVGDAVLVAAFANTYAPAAADPVTPELNKVLAGRDWTADDRFTFDIAKVSFNNRTSGADFDAMPMPEKTSATLNEDGDLEGTKSGESVGFNFGSLTFTKAGTYVYKVTEQHPDDATQSGDNWVKDGLTYTGREVTITISVTDDTTAGKLVAGTPTITDNGTFNNTYTASQYFDEAVDFQLTKTLNGHDMAKGQFSFNVTALDGVGTTAAQTAEKVGLPSTTVPVPGAAGADGQKVVMMDGNQQMRFTQADSGRTFVLQFSEVQPNPIPDGYTYDNAVYTMEITPSDLGNGTMSIATKVTKSWTDASGAQTSTIIDTTADAWQPGERAATVSLDFVNEYESTGTIALSGTKTIGEPWASGPAGFEFIVDQVGDADGGAITADTVKAVLPDPATAISDANGNFTFGNITFSEPGVYYFKMTEANKGIPGVTYDDSAKVVIVNVTEQDGGNGNGVLSATVAEDSPDLSFTNTYEQQSSEAYVPPITKAVAGHDAAAEQFEFQLIAVDDATKAAIANQEITGPTGAELTVDQNGVVETTFNKVDIANGTESDIVFSGLVFNKVVASPGYNFIVKEVVEADDDSTTYGTQNAGWTMDTHEYKINITVEDRDSQLTVVPTYTDADGKQTSGMFSNTFGAATTLGDNGGLNVTKELQNRTLEAEQFDFIVGVAAGSASYDDALEKLANASGNDFDAVSGTLTFSNGVPDANGKAVMSPLDSLAFDQNDIGKTFTYTVSEKTDTGLTDKGYTYDATPSATVEIAVKEGDGGKIYTETMVTKGDDVKVYGKSDKIQDPAGETAVVPFVNSYTANGSAKVEATKTLNNRDMVEDEFVFGIVPQGSAQNGSADVATAKNDANGDISFTIKYAIGQLNQLVAENASYVTKNTDGTWTLSYTAYEKAGLPEGVTADRASFDFTVTVEDSGDGTLTATPTYAMPGTTNTFTNTYGKDAKASASIAATKTLHGRDQQDGEFKFSVKQGDAAGNGPEVLTGAGTAGDMDTATKVMFAGKTDGAAAAEQGVLGEYTFESLKAAVDAGWASYEADTKTWTLKYSISELTDSTNMPAGVSVTTGHPDHYDFTVTVTDDGQGKLTATTNYPQDGKTTFDFDNTYGQNTSVTTSVTGTKTLAGDFASALDITGKYTFTLVNADGSKVTGHMAEGFVASATNPDAGGGSITLGGLVFTMDDIKDVAFGNDGTRSKTFTYKVTETETDGAVPGVTNDEAAGVDKGKTVTVTLTDDGKGNLTAAATDFEFVNTYAPGSATNTPADVTKKLTGNREQGLQAGEFEFEMGVAAKDGSPADGFTMPGDGSNPQVKSNAAPTATEGDSANVGAVVFGNITFTKPGTYTVMVSEKVPSGDKMQPFMTYDGHTYSYDVEVKVGGADLTAGVVEGSVNGSPQFVNNYDKPEKSVSEIPESGVQVGDELTYTIEWANTTGVAAQIEVSDELTQGLAYVDGSQKVELKKDDAAETLTPDGFDANGQSLSWKFNVEPNTSGTVTFKAKVTEAALTIEGDTLNNMATITVGDNPFVETNTVPVPKPQTGSLEVQKEVVSSDPGVTPPTDAKFSFTVAVKVGENNIADGTYGGVEFKDGVTKFELGAGEAKLIDGLPAGAKYEVAEAQEDGYAASYAESSKGSIDANGKDTVVVTNTYTPGSETMPGKDNLKVSKTLDGRDGMPKESYTFELEPVSYKPSADSDVVLGAEIPMPNSKTVSVGGG